MSSSSADYSGWIKLHRKALESKDLMSFHPSVRWIFIGYLLIACKTGKWRGYLTDQNGKPISRRERAKLIGVDQAWLARREAEFIEKNMLKEMASGRLKIEHYSDYQADGGTTNGNGKEKPAPKPEPEPPIPEPEEPEQDGGPKECGWCARPKTATKGAPYLLQQYHDIHVERVGKCPAMTACGKMGGMFGKLLGAYQTEDTIVAAMRLWFATANQATADRGYPLEWFMNEYNGLQTRVAKGETAESARPKAERGGKRPAAHLRILNGNQSGDN